MLSPPPPPPPLLSVFVCLSKVYSYPLLTVLCNKNPSWLSTSGTDEKMGPLCNWLFVHFRPAPPNVFCNFLSNDVNDGNYDDNDNLS